MHLGRNVCFFLSVVWYDRKRHSFAKVSSRLERFLVEEPKGEMQVILRISEHLLSKSSTKALHRLYNGTLDPPASADVYFNCVYTAPGEKKATLHPLTIIF